MNKQRADAAALAGTVDVLERLFVLVRQVALHGKEHEQVQAGAEALRQAIAQARPPFALQLLPEAVLRDSQPLPLELEVHRRSQQLVGALTRWKMNEIRFEALPAAEALIAFAEAVMNATHTNRTARVPDLEHVALRALRRPTLLGSAAGESALEAFATRQVERALGEVERLGGEQQPWPWHAGRAVLWRLERCLLTSAAATARRIELAPAPWSAARRALACAFYVSAVLARTQAGLITQRAAAHSALALGWIGLARRPGMAFADAAQAALPLMLPTAGGEPLSIDPHRLRATALTAAAARGERAFADLPLTALLFAVHELERRRCPPLEGVQLTRSDLHAWLAGALGRELHAGWGRALLDVLGPIPPGSHVLAEGRLGVVVGDAPRSDAWRPRVLVAGQLAIPAQPVQLHSPLGMTPWAK